VARSECLLQKNTDASRACALRENRSKLKPPFFGVRIGVGVGIGVRISVGVRVSVRVGVGVRIKVRVPGLGVRHSDAETQRYRKLAW
jgi:hypothetical protein